MLFVTWKSSTLDECVFSNFLNCILYVHTMYIYGFSRVFSFDKGIGGFNKKKFL